VTKTYVNFHAHSHGSLLDGASRPSEYAQRAIDLQMPAITFTDHGNIHTLLDAYDAAKSLGLNFFPGEEFYQARKTRFDVDPEERAGPATEEWQQRGPYHMGVVAYNNAGYHNLIKLSSRAFLEGYFVKPRIDHELLAEHSDGLVLFSGCLSGEIQQALLRDDFAFALKTAAKMQEIVGKENYFIELQNHGIPEELKNHASLIEIANKIGAPIVPTCDSHYTHEDDHNHHDLMLCINTGSRVNTEGRFKFSGNHFYLKSYDQMASLFPEEYLKNTLLIAEKYDLNLTFNEYHFPNYDVPVGKTVEQYFDEMVFLGAQMRYGPDWKANKEVVDRLEYEMGVIKQMGFPNYFLVVADIVNWCKKNGIMMGAGRGSAAGSLVSFCLKITEVDPLIYDLPFERFLVPGRKTMPDIDIDIDDRFREDAIAYTRERYGYDHTCQIVTFGEMGAKKAVRDIARVLNYPFELGDKISKAMPPAVFGVSKDLDECLSTKEFRDLYETDTDVKTIVDSAKKLEGLWRDVGIHAAGLVIADKPIIEYIPVMQKGEGKPIVSQWDMHRVEQCGLLKIDFLGLRNLSIISMCLDMIKDTKGVEIKEPYRLLEEEDPAVYAALGRGENIGVFQVESEGIRELLIGMKPSSLEDISAILSLYRPGPMGSNVHNEYIERKHGRKPITAVHPVLKELLKDTYGLLLYQEQLLKIATDVAGFSIGEADDLRKAVGKKIKEKMQGLKSDFIDGCEKKQIVTRQQAEKLFAEIEHHASYSFSKNHAVSYGFTTYLTSYLRTHYPTEYMAAALSTVQDKKERLRLYLNECRRLGISVLPPSVNYSEFLFKVKSDTEIVYGFSAIKGVGEVIANQMVATRTSEYVSLFDFLRSVDNSILNKKVLEHFAAAGCFDDLLLLTDIDCDDLTRSQRMEILYGESEELGVFLSDHPFAEVSDLVLDKATHTISQVNENITGQMVKVGGVVVNVDKIITKAGKKMYKVYLEDMEGSITVTIFPTAALKLPDPPFEKGDIAIITGKIERGSEDENSTITLVFFDFEKISTQHLVGGRPIFLKTDKPVSYKRIKQMSDIISNTNGNSPVFLEYAEDGRQITLRFKELTSKSTEESLRFLLEVST
jgi:DNA polymerase-3 subunit alpha